MIKNELRKGGVIVSDMLNVKMLGGFSMEYRDRSVDDQSNRMKKVWLLLAYLIYSRNSSVTQDHYIDLLQGAGGDDSADPNGKLKAMFYRARTMLNQLDDEAGHGWIIRKNGTYAWNPEVEVNLDVEEFERFCAAAAAAGDDREKLALYRKALALYRGDLLPKLGAEPWVMPISAYYHQMYLTAAEHALALLEQEKLWPELAALCEQAIKVEPYCEELYQHRMRGLIASGDRAGAQRVYVDMSELLFATFGVMPSDESRALYREASRDSGENTIPVGTVRDQLRETNVAKGAMFCEYDFFRLLYQVQARAIIRTGDAVHIGLFSVHGHGKKELARRSLDIAMDNLQELAIASLRQGDVVTRCSVSQIIIMLSQANYENSCAVCERILKAFGRQYPHSPADIHYSVQPLEPLEPR